MSLLITTAKNKNLLFKSSQAIKVITYNKNDGIKNIVNNHKKNFGNEYSKLFIYITRRKKTLQ